MFARQKTQREELVEAREKLRRQIEILESGPGSSNPWARQSDNANLLAELRGILSDLDKKLEADDA